MTEFKKYRYSILRSFLFSFKNNEMKIFKPTSSRIYLKKFSDSENQLVQIGNKDIIIEKEYNKNKCYCSQSYYNLQGNKNLFLDDSLGNEVQFTPKRIQVIQMGETEFGKQEQ